MPKETLIRFVRTYLLEAAQPHVRWHMHTLLASLFKHSQQQQAEATTLYETLMQMWPEATTVYGAKAAQYVDLVGFMNISLAYGNTSVLRDFLQKSIDLYKSSIGQLTQHPNGQLYKSLAGVLQEHFDGYYLEPEPCFACNQLEQPILNHKLNSIKVKKIFY